MKRIEWTAESNGKAVALTLATERIKVRVPADQAAAVKALVAEYRAEVERRIDADLAVSKEYDEGRERMRQVMGY